MIKTIKNILKGFAGVILGAIISFGLLSVSNPALAQTANFWTQNALNSLATNTSGGLANADIHVKHCYIGTGTGTPCGGSSTGTVTSIQNADGALLFSPNPITTTGIIGLDTTHANIWTPTAGTGFTQNNIGVVPTTSLLVENASTTSAPAPVQISSALEFLGHMRQTSNSTDHIGTFRMYQIPQSGANAGNTNAGTLQWDMSKDGAYTTNLMNLNRLGTLITANGFLATSGSLNLSNGSVLASGNIQATDGQGIFGREILTGTNGGSFGGKIFMFGVTSGNLSISVPAVVSTYNSIWPGAQGTGALTNDGAGNLSWTPVSSTIATDFTLTGDGSGGSPLGINLGHTNTWTIDQTFQQKVTYGATGIANGKFKLIGTTAGSLDFTVPNSISTYALTFPSAAATVTGQAITSDTSGNLSFTSVTSQSATPVNLTAQTAAVSATTLFTPATTGQYRVSVYLQVTTAASVSSVLGGATGVTLTYNDGDGNVAQTDTVALMNTAGGIAVTSSTNSTATNLNGTVTIYARAGVPVQFSVGYTSAGTAMQYAAHLRAEAI